MILWIDITPKNDILRDRRYTYKGLCKSSKKEVAEAAKSNDAAWLKSAKNKASRSTNDAITISNFALKDFTYKARH